MKAIPVDEAFLKVVAIYESEKDKVDAFNQAIRTANGLITKKKTEAGTADVTTATSELTRLKATKTRHSQSVAKLCEKHTRMAGEKKAIETQKTAIRSQLDTHTASVVTPYQKRINEFLDAFNAGFKIAETKHSYNGGVATSSYQLVINQTAIDIGGGKTPSNMPSFKNTLSAGDRTTLALAFFLAHLECDGGLSRKIVVFDDPFNSQDSFRRHQTIHEIMKIARQCAQVIVLPHDATFLKQIWDKSPPAERAALTIANHVQMGSKIAVCDIEKACQGRTANDIDDLQSYVTNGAGAHIDIIRKMRVVLETYMRTTYPINFSDRDWLGDIVRKIRGDTDHPAAPMYDELNEINDYTAPYHHDENVADYTPDTIDSTELLGFARRTLKIVNALQS
ncbi:MAG: AAA family ATPase [Nitrospirae bacterium]|nr:AAA family ATPase [Nitrospirota bacterium]